MTIIEKDCKIEHNGDCFVLYFLKSKKELKEDSKESFKTIGYYNDVYNALRVIYFWRLDKKYPFSETVFDFKHAIIAYKKVTIELRAKAMSIYQPIYTFKKKVFNGNR